MILEATEFTSLPLSLIQEVENSYDRYTLSSKVSFKAEGNCIKSFGENFYNIRAGIKYFVSSLFDIETGYQLVHSKIDTLKDINPSDIGLYGKLVLKF